MKGWEKVEALPCTPTLSMSWDQGTGSGGHGLGAHLAMLIRELQPQPHTDQTPLENATHANISRLPETSIHYPWRNLKPSRQLSLQ